MSAVPLLLMGLLLAAPGDSARPSDGFPPKRVGVLVLGPDDAAVGDLQRVLELRLNALPDVDVVGAGELGSLVPGGSRARAPSQKSEPAIILEELEMAEIEKTFEEVRAAYYTNQLVKAFDVLAQQKVIYEQAGKRDADSWVQLLLWRTAVLVSMGEPGQAESEAIEALRLAPDLEVDLRVFQPSVAREVKRIRATLGDAKRVTLVDLPEGSVVSLGEFQLPGHSFRVFPGKHRVSVASPGRRLWTRDLEVKAELSLRPSLGVAVRPDLAESLSSSIWKGSIESAAGREFSKLLPELKLDWMLVAATRSEPSPEVRGLMVSVAPRTDLYSRTFSLSVAPAAIADWAQATLERSNPSIPVATATPRPTAEPPRTTFAPSPRAGGYALFALGAHIPQESNYSEGRVSPGPSLQTALGYRAPHGLSVEGGVHFSGMNVGADVAAVIEPFLALRFTPIRFGNWTPSLMLGFSPWTVLRLEEPIEIREGRTDILRGSSVDLALGLRRPAGERFFLTGDLRYMIVRYHAATMDGSVSTGRILQGDQLSIVGGVGLLF